MIKIKNNDIKEGSIVSFSEPNDPKNKFKNENKNFSKRKT